MRRAAALRSGRSSLRAPPSAASPRRASRSPTWSRYPSSAPPTCTATSFRATAAAGSRCSAAISRNLRAARAADGGAVLLIDAGDTFQAGIESNLSEGAIVVDAYDALGYTAAVIGNHEFDFGPVDSPGRASRSAPIRAARSRPRLRARAFRFSRPTSSTTPRAARRLAERPPSVLVEAAGVKVGIVGVMSIDALRATLPVNVQGLRVTPLAAAVATEAAKLRAAGARVVIVGAHAGGACASSPIQPTCRRATRRRRSSSSRAPCRKASST